MNWRSPRLSTSDAAVRMLSLAVRLLPASRSQWSAAMHAELSVLEGASTRRRFVLSCTRAILKAPGSARSAWYPSAAVTTGAAGLVLSLGMKSAILRVEAGATIILLGACSWFGTRPGALGPVAAAPSVRRIRAAGSLGVAACLLVVDARLRFPSAADSAATSVWLWSPP